MKKFLALLLTALMLLSSLPVLAEASAQPLPDFGMALVIPDAFSQAEYTVSMDYPGIVSRNPYVCAMFLNYYAIPGDELAARAAQVDGNDPESVTEFEKLSTTLGLAMVTDAASAKEALKAAFDMGDDEMDDEGMTVTEFGAVEPYHYYYIAWKDDEFPANVAGQADPEKVRAEMEQLNESMLKALREAELFMPEDTLAKAIGTSLVFETTDLDGNPVNTADLFKANKVTMVNFWGSWCPYCVDEMPELARIHTRLQQKGCGIVGMQWEKQPVKEVEDAARSIMEQAGTNYPNVLAPEERFDFIDGYPCSVFVDSEGRIMTYPISGVALDEYESTIDALLAGEEVTPDAEPAAIAPVISGEYRIAVTDGEGPVKDVIVQFCDDDSCAFQETDENGVATFRPDKASVYEVHILKVPDGYADHAEVYKTEATWSNLEITIQKAN